MSDTITDWRQLTDQLTAQQVESFLYRESVIEPSETRRALLVQQAQAHVEGNRKDRELFGHIPPPAGAQRIGHWQVDTENGGWSRDFSGRSWNVGGFGVDVEGRQLADGTVEAYGWVSSEGAEFSADQARQIAAVMREAAEELDRIRGS